MLMQPQSPNPDFDFMLKNQQPAKKGMPLPNLPKPIKIILAAVFGIFILIVILSVVSGRNSSGSQPLVDVLGRGQETLRITQLTQQQLPLSDPQTQALAATAYTSLSSEQAQLISYMKKNHYKYSKAQLAAFTDKTTDTTLQTAAQNNNLDAAYVSFLKDALTKYKNDIQTAYQNYGPNGRLILHDAFDSTSTLLASQQLKS
ncbi:MAG TPA: hypothetical protein VLF88_02100 [Candidatus Babeliales bacterium]|nr:hypothetical protein [Candidatus Babeliales bacterium]